MYRVRDILDELEQIAPTDYAFSFDKVGLQVGSSESPVTRVVVSLDASMGAIAFAAEQQAQLLLSHHPVIWEPMKNVLTDSYQGGRISQMIQSNVAFVAAHTNWDCAKGGVNDALAEGIGLKGVTVFGSSSDRKLVKVVVFVPPTHESAVVDAMSEAGAGRIGEYSRCAFSTTGQGTFIGSSQSQPSIGQKERIESVQEIKVEMVTPESQFGSVISALRSVHPYEEPAYDVVLLENSAGYPIGRIGSIAPLSPLAFQAHLDTKLGSRSQMWLPDSIGVVSKIAVVGGAAADEWRQAKKAGAEVFVTGEVPHHIGLEASESGMVMFAAGHYQTEQPGVVALASRLRQKFNLDFVVFQPESGQAGRPS